MNARVQAALIVVGLGFAEVAAAAPAPRTFDTPLGPLEFLGELRVDTGTRIAGTEVGGLSALVYDRESRTYLALSDDPAEHGPARLYSFTLELGAGRLDAESLTWKGMTELLDTGDVPFATKGVDPEGLALQPDGGLVVSSEGQVVSGVAPFLRRYERNGHLRQALELPAEMQPAPRRGIRHNRGGEGLARTPDGRTLFLAVEGPLAQDGPDPTPTAGALSRLYRFDLGTGRLQGAYLVPLEPVHAVSVPAGGLEVSGISEVLALDADTVVIVERSFARGAGHAIRLALVDLREASDVSRIASLAELDDTARAALRPARRTPILDLAALEIPLDNLEGLTLGPFLPDGRRTLVMVSDNNFSGEQFTQFLAFAVGRGGLTVPAIQGAGHRSPFAGQFVTGVAGVVTAVDGSTRGDGGFWLQGPADGDAATSDALFVSTGNPPGVHPGDGVRVSGRVEERGVPRGLTSTVLGDGAVELTASGVPLPPAVPLAIPRQGMDDDGLTRFEPATDALDAYESLEGMRVELTDALVVGPTRHGEIVVLPDEGRGSGPRTLRGGLRASETDPQPERVLLGDRLVSLPEAAVGDRFPGVLRGVLAAVPSGFRLLPTEPLPARVPAPWAAETTTLGGRPDRLTLASLNVENLSAVDPAERFERLATTVVAALRAPDVLALQEVQDDNGAAARGPDGVVGAAATLNRLIDAIVAAGGPRYTYRQIDPVEGAEGGAPGGNIRVAFLLDPARVQPVDRGRAGATDATEVRPGPTLFPSPGRVEPRNPAWAWSRVPLALEIQFRGRPYFLIANHWASKGADDRSFGAVQPPVPRSEPGRRAQAAVVHAFVAKILAQQADARVVVLGDLNEHEGRPAVRDLTAGGDLVDLIERLPEADRYTYEFEGRSQVLDHILVSRALAARAEVDVVHVNAELPQSRQGSDHDPVLVAVE